MRRGHGEIRVSKSGSWLWGLLGFGLVVLSPIAVSTVETPLMTDSHFESSVGAFVAQDAGRSVAHSGQASLDDAHSMDVSIAGELQPHGPVTAGTPRIVRLQVRRQPSS